MKGSVIGSKIEIRSGMAARGPDVAWAEENLTFRWAKPQKFDISLFCLNIL